VDQKNLEGVDRKLQFSEQISDIEDITARNSYFASTFPQNMGFSDRKFVFLNENFKIQKISFKRQKLRVGAVTPTPTMMQGHVACEQSCSKVAKMHFTIRTLINS